MADELKTVRAYIKAVGKYWWAMVTGLTLTLLDGAERVLGTWYTPPLWAKVTAGVAGLAVAQYLAYRDLACSAMDATAEFKERLRTLFRRAELRLSSIDALRSPREILEHIDDFRASLETLYAECPPSWDSRQLRAVVEILDATARGIGRNSMTLPEQAAERLYLQMKGALAEVQAMLQ
jgi:hypothetical protein